MNNHQVISIWKDKVINYLDALRLVKKKIKVDKIGHCGTLDPFAEGILVFCTGNKTKEIDSFMNYEKEYIATIFLGEETDTLDLTGKSILKSKIIYSFYSMQKKCLLLIIFQMLWYLLQSSQKHLEEYLLKRKQ